MHIHSTLFRRSFVISSILLGSLSLLFTLAACSVGGLGGSSGSATPTPTPALKLTTYQAKTFSIGYPNAWNATNDDSYVTALPGAESASFDEESTTVIVESVRDTPHKPASLFLTSITDHLSAATLHDSKPANLPPTVKIGQETWLQRGDTGDGGSNGVKLPEKITCLANYHAPNNYLYGICLITPTGSLGRDPAIDGKFQAMLNSFQFK